jgi:uncharacterized repeat protein (TIGR03803 family)
LIKGQDGNFYGTTQSGGVFDEGTVFTITTTGAESVLYSFDSAPDASNPAAPLVLGTDGNFYGTAQSNGAFGSQETDGAIFKITPAGSESVLHSFGGTATDGQYPVAGLIEGSDGNFYGTTELGGTNCNAGGVACGTFFKVTPAGVETVLYNFGATVTDGNQPIAGLVIGADGNFYGTTQLGGTHGVGTVYKMTPQGVETVLYSFGATSTDGAEPAAGLILAKDGNFYGTTSAGGAHDQGGTVFKITPEGVETVVYSFGASSSDGTFPVASLIQGADGNFYGTTSVGGSNGKGSSIAGIVFKLTPAGVETVLHSFSASAEGDGSDPEGALIQDSAGNLYGTTFLGGANGNGTVFKITL